METLLGRLSTQRLLLVLDNCEHLLDACAQLAGAVLGRCPGVQILATSRQSLDIGGEVSRSVPSLAVPPVESLDSAAAAEQVGGYDAVRLFVDRAGGVGFGFAMS